MEGEVLFRLAGTHVREVHPAITRALHWCDRSAEARPLGRASNPGGNNDQHRREQ